MLPHGSVNSMDTSVTPIFATYIDKNLDDFFASLTPFVLRIKLRFNIRHVAHGFETILEDMYKTSLRVLLIFPFISLTSTRPFRRPEVINSVIHDINNLNGHLGHLEDFLYGLPDGKTGGRVAEWHENMTSNPEELGSYAEGDILFPMGTGRNGLRACSARWPNGVVPYVISPYFGELFASFKINRHNNFNKLY